MKIKELIENLEKSGEFREWNSKPENKDSYLAHVFKMLDEANKDSWQVGYYNAKRDRITTFIVEASNITISPETEIFKEPGKSINKLELEKVKIDSEEAMNKTNELVAKEYPKNVSLKEFYIIQTLPESGTVFNITFLTQAFKTINIKINAENGDIVKHQIVDIIQQDTPKG